MKSVIFNLGSNHQDFIFTVFSTSARTAPPFYLPPCILYNIVYALQDGNRKHIPACIYSIYIYFPHVISNDPPLKECSPASPPPRNAPLDE